MLLISTVGISLTLSQVLLGRVSRGLFEVSVLPAPSPLALPFCKSALLDFRNLSSTLCGRKEIYRLQAPSPFITSRFPLLSLTPYELNIEQFGTGMVVS